MASLKQRHAQLIAKSTPYAVVAEVVQGFQKYEPSLLARQSAMNASREHNDHALAMLTKVGEHQLT